MRTTLLTSLFIFGLMILARSQDLDARQKAAKRLSDSCILQSRKLVAAGQREKGKETVQKAIDISRDAGVLTELGYSYWEMAGYYDYSNAQFATKLDYIQRSVNAFHQAGDIKKEADALKELADARQVSGNYEQSYDELRQALRLYQSINEPEMERIYDLLGDVCTSLGDLNDAVSYGLLAEQAAEKINDTSMQRCTTYNHLGMAYYYLHEYPTSTMYYGKALAVAEKYKSMPDITIVSFNYANNLRRTGKFSECIDHMTRILKTYPSMDTSWLIRFVSAYTICYSFLGNLDAAGKYYDRMNRLTRGRSLDNEVQGEVYTSSFFYLLATKNYGQVRDILKAEEAFDARRSGFLAKSINLSHWVKLDSATGDYRAAFVHMSRYGALRDSILNREKARDIAGLTIQYETKKKDQDLLLKQKDIDLLKRDKELKVSELSQSNQVRNGALGAGILLLVIVGLLVNNSRVKQRANWKLRAQQKEIEKKNNTLEHLLVEKEWLVKEIHHRVKNNFHMVIALLGTQSEYLRTEEAIRAITDSQNRVQAMSLVHQKLYQSDDLSDIAMSDYIHELVYHLRTILDIGPAIQFRFDLEPIRLDLTYSIPLGLIINEAVTNAAKYAFAGARGASMADAATGVGAAGGGARSDDGAMEGIGADADAGRGRSDGGVMEGIGVDVDARRRRSDDGAMEGIGADAGTKARVGSASAGGRSDGVAMEGNVADVDARRGRTAGVGARSDNGAMEGIGADAAATKAAGGQITISLKRLPDDLVELRIVDNGVGLPEGYDMHRIESMGLKLIKGLSDDIEASLDIISHNGVQVVLRFSYDSLAASRRE